ncbi:ArsR family transcriptional regulator [Micromonospora rosaria]|uniref:ArsR family transcriptional regulator n=1 Tax=Micromonospora rosaria TaxID=47874 RepID=A0A136PSE7_9ACTN|nr:metalloregulator ArsR/SmtB family transcription factor [Micromonospora rosaria]KXK61391.1 ArsR family transcriptional regulator [Micromonospora rosaria]
MVDLFTVLADPSRRRILDTLRGGDGLIVKELTAALDLSQPNVSKHLRVLREAGLVTETVERQRRRYRLRPDALRELDAWLAPYRRFWVQRLDDLADHLDSSTPPEGT